MSYALRCSLQVIARFISLPLIWSYAKPSCQWGLDPSSLGYIYSTFLVLQIAATPSRLLQHKIATFGNSFNFLIQLFLLSMDHPILPVFVDFLLTPFQLLFAALAVNDCFSSSMTVILPFLALHFAVLFQQYRLYIYCYLCSSPFSLFCWLSLSISQYSLSSVAHLF